MDSHGAVLHFSNKHDNYNWAYHICQVDKQVVLSPGHPDLIAIGCPRTSKCVKVFHENTRKRKSDVGECSNSSRSSGKCQSQNNNKVRRLSNVDVAKFLVESNIKKQNELLAAAKQRQQAGNEDLYNFCVLRDCKKINQLIESTWRMESASEEVAREKLCRMEILSKVESGDCVNGCEGEWYECALEVLTNNSINPMCFRCSLTQVHWERSW